MIIERDYNTFNKIKIIILNNHRMAIGQLSITKKSLKILRFNLYILYIVGFFRKLTVNCTEIASEIYN